MWLGCLLLPRSAVPCCLPLHPLPPASPLQVLRLQALLDGWSRVRNTLCVVATLGLGGYMALSSAVSLGTCYSVFVFRSDPHTLAVGYHNCNNYFYLLQACCGLQHGLLAPDSSFKI